MQAMMQSRVCGARHVAGFRPGAGDNEEWGAGCRTGYRMQSRGAGDDAECRTRCRAQSGVQGGIQGGQGTVGHLAACEDGACTGSHPAQWGQGVVPTSCGSRVAALPWDRDKGHLSPPGWSAGADTGSGADAGSGAGTAPFINPHAELWAGSGSSALIVAAQPADLALNPSACHRLRSSQHGSGGDEGPVPAAVCCAMPDTCTRLCHTPCCARHQPAPEERGSLLSHLLE